MAQSLLGNPDDLNYLLVVVWTGAIKFAFDGGTSEFVGLAATSRLGLGSANVASCRLLEPKDMAATKGLCTRRARSSENRA